MPHDASRARDATWPESPKRSGVLFAPRYPLRKVVVQIDAELALPARTGTPPASPGELLSDLLQHELVECYLYSDDGPPPGVAPVSGTDKVFEGWVVATSGPDGDGEYATYTPDGNRLVISGVWGGRGDDPSALEEDNGSGGIRPTGGAARRRRDRLAAQVASRALGADIYVTERPYLLGLAAEGHRGTVICNPEDALAVLGLYFRAQGKYLLTRTVESDRDGYFIVASRELLPQSWRWTAAGAQAAEGEIGPLAHSLLARVASALEARDGVHLAASRAAAGDRGENVLFHVDAVTLFLHAAVDLSARVAHRVLGLKGEERGASWRRRAWVSELKAAAPDLASAIERGGQGGRLFDVLRTFRNTIHGDALHNATMVDGREVKRLVGLPAAEVRNALALIDQLGGREAWGVERDSEASLWVRPETLIERLFSGVLPLLNELMARTPVELLPGVNLAPADLGPPPDSDRIRGASPMDSRFRTSIRWQLGISRP